MRIVVRGKWKVVKSRPYWKIADNHTPNANIDNNRNATEPSWRDLLALDRFLFLFQQFSVEIMQICCCTRKHEVFLVTRILDFGRGESFAAISFVVRLCRSSIERESGKTKRSKNFQSAASKV